MQKLILIILVLLFNVKGNAQQQTVYFDSDSYFLSNDEKEKLNRIVERISNSYSSRKFSITGFTDSDANNKYNSELALKRAKAVNNYLVENGVKNECYLFSKGETDLVLENDKTENKKASRRVAINFNYHEKNQIEDLSRNKNNVFVISALRDTILICEKGTRIEITKDIFDTPNKTTPIIIKVEEYLEKKDFIFAGLNTVDDKGLLIESRGMINITAFQRDREIKLKRNSLFNILFKDRIEGDETKLFYGKMQNEKLVWELAKDSVIDKRKQYSEFYTRTKMEYGKSKVIGFVENQEVYLHDKIDTSYQEKCKGRKTKFARANSTVMSSNRLGWINCDLFIDDPREKMDLIVKNSGNENANIVLFFSDLNSMLPPSKNENGFITFENVPVGSKVSIIGVYAIDQEKPMDVAFINTELNNCDEYVLNYKKMNIETFKSILKKV